MNHIEGQVQDSSLSEICDEIMNKKICSQVAVLAYISPASGFILGGLQLIDIFIINYSVFVPRR